jgi:hypothetical protein
VKSLEACGLQENWLSGGLTREEPLPRAHPVASSPGLWPLLSFPCLAFIRGTGNLKGEGQGWGSKVPSGVCYVKAGS